MLCYACNSANRRTKMEAAPPAGASLAPGSWALLDDEFRVRLRERLISVPAQAKSEKALRAFAFRGGAFAAEVAADLHFVERGEGTPPLASAALEFLYVLRPLVLQPLGTLEEPSPDGNANTVSYTHLTLPTKA